MVSGCLRVNFEVAWSSWRPLIIPSGPLVGILFALTILGLSAHVYWTTICHPSRRKSDYDRDVRVIQWHCVKYWNNFASRPSTWQWRVCWRWYVQLFLHCALWICLMWCFQERHGGWSTRLKTTCCSWQHHCDALAPMPGPCSFTVLYDACGFQCLSRERARTLCKHWIGSSCFSFFPVCW